MSTTRILSVAVALSVMLATYQCGRIRYLQSRMEAERAAAGQQVKKMALESLKNRRADLARTGMWLHTFYQSPEGLQRPQGLWIDGHPDFDGIAAWLLDVYLNERVAGASEEKARQTVIDAIRQTDEWRRKHPGT